MTFHHVQRRVETLLREAGCEEYTAQRALADAATCWREVRRDSIEHRGSSEEPIFTFVVAEGVAVLWFLGTNVDVYVVRADELTSPDNSKPLLTTEAEWVFRDRFESLAMVEVEAARAILASDFNREAPDLTIDAQLSRAWLSASGGATPG